MFRSRRSVVCSKGELWGELHKLRAVSSVWLTCFLPTSSKAQCAPVWNTSTAVCSTLLPRPPEVLCC